MPSAMANSTILNVKVVPGASRTEISGWLEDTLKIRVAAPPEKGKANRAVERLLAKALGIANQQVRIKAGTESPRKVVEIESLGLQDITERLDRFLQNPRVR